MTAAVQEEIIRAALQSFERLPLLEAVMDRCAQALGPALRIELGAHAEVAVGGVDYMGCGKALARAPDPGLIALVAARPWDGALAATLDPALLFAALEIMLGAPGAEGSGAAGWQPRGFTTIEKRLGQRIIDLALRELETAFAPLDTVAFAVRRVESAPRDIRLASATAACVRVALRVTLDGRGGELGLLIPHATLYPLRDVLAQPRDGRLGGDPSWRALMSDSLRETAVTLTAVLHEPVLPLAEVLAWRPGQVIDLGIDGAHEVTVDCSGRAMFRAAIGRRRNGTVALRVTAALEEGPKEEAADGAAD